MVVDRHNLDAGQSGSLRMVLVLRLLATSHTRSSLHLPSLFEFPQENPALAVCVHGPLVYDGFPSDGELSGRIDTSIGVDSSILESTGGRYGGALLVLSIRDVLDLREKGTQTCLRRNVIQFKY